VQRTLDRRAPGLLTAESYIVSRCRRWPLGESEQGLSLPGPALRRVQIHPLLLPGRGRDLCGQMWGGRVAPLSDGARGAGTPVWKANYMTGRSYRHHRNRGSNARNDDENRVPKAIGERNR
jgi:hypothetical protein